MCVRDDTDAWAVPKQVDLPTVAADRPAEGGPTLRVTRPPTSRLLFPPVRPRGYLELRMIDGQSGGWWVVPVAVVAALFGDAIAADEAFAVTERLNVTPGADYRSGPRARAARSGLRDPLLAAIALELFLAAYAALARQGVTRAVREAVAGFIERYVSRGLRTGRRPHRHAAGGGVTTAIPIDAARQGVPPQ